MARTAKSTNTEPVVDAATVDDSTVAAVNSVEENINAYVSWFEDDAYLP